MSELKASDGMKTYMEQIIENPSAYLIDIESRIEIAKEYLALQAELDIMTDYAKKLERLSESISKAIAEIEKLQTAYINEGDTHEYEVIGGALDILAGLKGEE